jgi:hypothetical protein
MTLQLDWRKWLSAENKVREEKKAKGIYYLREDLKKSILSFRNDCSLENQYPEISWIVKYD